MDLSNVIKNRIYIDDDYTFSLDKFRLPKFLHLPKSSRRNLFLEHQDALVKYDSLMSEGFRKDLKEWHPGTYIREFPVPIEDKILWENLIRRFNVEEEKRSTNYFLIDYVFHKRGFCIEIDGDPYHTTPNYDKARDEYIYFALGWKTYRFKNYARGTDFKRFSKIYKSSKEINGIRDLFTTTAINSYAEKVGIDTLRNLSIILDEIPSSLISDSIQYFPKSRINFLIEGIDRRKIMNLRLTYHYLFGNELRIT